MCFSAKKRELVPFISRKMYCAVFLGVGNSEASGVLDRLGRRRFGEFFTDSPHLG
jgi:hypothetical protein